MLPQAQLITLRVLNMQLRSQPPEGPQGSLLCGGHSALYYLSTMVLSPHLANFTSLVPSVTWLRIPKDSPSQPSDLSDL